jgi:sporulation protein YlmC with PRC-barrel domain
MLEEASELIGLQVYTSQGIYLGNVSNLVVEVDENKIQGLFVSNTNPLLVEGSKAVNVPYRWISSVGDIVILKYFPKRVALKRGSPKPKSEKTTSIE